MGERSEIVGGILRGLPSLILLGAVIWMVWRGDSQSRHNGDRGGLVMVGALQSAIENFHGEYRRIPEVGAMRVETNREEGAELLNILLAKERGEAPLQNVREVVFLQLKQARHKRGGLDSEEDRVIGCYDPYGNHFSIFLNSGNKEVLEFRWGGQHVSLRGKQVAVASVGKDGKEGTRDDIRSWK